MTTILSILVGWLFAIVTILSAYYFMLQGHIQISHGEAFRLGMAIGFSFWSLLFSLLGSALSVLFLCLAVRLIKKVSHKDKVKDMNNDHRRESL
jgi:predicted membrane protein